MKTYPQCAVPATRAERHAIRAHTQAAHSVLMAGKDTHSFALESIPDITGPIVVTTEKDTTRDGECNGGDTAENVVMGEGIELAVSPDIEKTTRGVIRAGGKRITIREEAMSNVNTHGSSETRNIRTLRR